MYLAVTMTPGKTTLFDLLCNDLINYEFSKNLDVKEIYGIYKLYNVRPIKILNIEVTSKLELETLIKIPEQSLICEKLHINMFICRNDIIKKSIDTLIGDFLKNLQIYNNKRCKQKEIIIEFNIKKFKNLRKLVIHRGNIDIFPFEITTLKYLQELDLSSNNLEIIPEEIKNLQKLHTLILSLNPLRIFPNEIQSLKNLRKIDLTGTILIEIPSLASFKKLVHLNLSSNYLKSLPGDITELTSLEYLNVSSNLLESLPEDLAKLTSLEYLNLKTNPLESLPEDITKLTSLKYLDLRSTNIETLPNEIYKLKNLLVLKIETNVPNPNLNLINLQELSLIQTNIRSFQFRNLHNLRELNLFIDYETLINNQDVILSELNSLQKLKVLNYTLYVNTKPKEDEVDIFKFFAKCPNLFKLSIYSLYDSVFTATMNDMQNIHVLEIFVMTSLKKPIPIKNLQNLRKLNLVSCKMTTEILMIEANNFKNLTHLNLKRNEIRSLCGIHKLTNLTHLNLSYNHIKNTKNYFLKMKKLINLDLSRNYIEEMPKFCRENKITDLNLNNNSIKEIKGTPCPSVINLDISYNIVKNFKGFGSMFKNLVTLNMKCHINEIDISITKLTHLKKLEILVGWPRPDDVKKGLFNLKAYVYEKENYHNIKHFLSNLQSFQVDDFEVMIY